MVSVTNGYPTGISNPQGVRSSNLTSSDPSKRTAHLKLAEALDKKITEKEKSFSFGRLALGCLGAAATGFLGFVIGAGAFSVWPALFSIGCAVAFCGLIVGSSELTTGGLSIALGPISVAAATLATMYKVGEWGIKQE